MKYIIRNQAAPCFSSRILQCLGENLPLKDIVKTYGKDFILSSVCSEDMKSEELEHKYVEFLQNGNTNYFSWMYELQPNFGVIIDSHITLCHYDADAVQQQSMEFGWSYIDNKKYLGDTWWFEDQEIIHDLTQLSVVEFFQKYKGI